MNKTTKKFLRDHLGAYIDSFEFEDINGTQGGMSSEAWFCKLVQYWDSKDEILSIYDRIGQRYSLPEWFDMPYNYSKEQCLYLIGQIRNLYVSNGRIFGGNAGFWYRDIQRTTSLESSVKGNYYALPWNLWLQNTNLLDKGVWSEIISAIKSNKSHSEYFAHLPVYQEMSSEKKRQLFELMENKIRKGKLLKYYMDAMSKDFQHSEILKSESYHLNKIKEVVKKNGIEKDHLIAAIYYS